MEEKKIDASEPREIMNLKEAAEYIGVSEDELKLLVKKNEIPHRQPKCLQRVFFSSTALAYWAAGQM